VVQSEGRVDRPANRLIFTQRQVHLWVEAHPHRWRQSFRIGGLENPVIQLVAGTHLVVTLVNLDYFNVARLMIVPHGPPFPPHPLSVDPWDHQREYRVYDGNMAAIVPPRGPKVVYDAVLDFQVRSPGTAWYIATSPFAAATGNYGRILVTP